MIPAKSELKKLLSLNQVQVTIDILRDLTQDDVETQKVLLLQSSRWHESL